MNHRSFLSLFLCVLGVASAVIRGETQAAPLARDASAIFAPKLSLMKKIGQGCGWDYPCPPVPEFGRRAGRRGGDIYIHNNYGPVNVYVRGGGREEAPRHMEARPCEIRGEGSGVCGERINCGGYPCDENCGPLCWMRRFKKGYCGHGCLTYLEQSRIAAEERAAREEEDREERREEREARDVYERGCYRDGCPAPRHERSWRREARHWHERPHYERPKENSLEPREPYNGPHYQGTCTGSDC